MNEGQLSTEVLESASQGASNAHSSAIAAEIITQTPTPSPVQMSTLVLEVIEKVPQTRASLTPAMN